MAIDDVSGVCSKDGIKHRKLVASIADHIEADMHKNIFALTTHRGAYPGYMSAYDAGSELMVTVRSAPDEADGDDTDVSACKPISHFSLNPEQALQLARALTEWCGKRIVQEAAVSDLFDGVHTPI